MLMYRNEKRSKIKDLLWRMGHVRNRGEYLKEETYAVTEGKDIL